MKALPADASARVAGLRGFLDAMAFPAWTVGLALTGVGSLARDVGHPVWAAMLSTVLVWAGPAQVLFYGMLASGTAPLAIAAAISLSSIRFLPMVMAIMPLIRRPGQRLGFQLLAAHFIAVTVWAESLRRLPTIAPESRPAYFFGFASACLGLATLTTGAGYYLAGEVPVPVAAGLLYLTPLFFTVSISAGARRPADVLAIGLGLVLQPLMVSVLGNELDLLGVGLVGGTLAWLFGRWWDRRGSP